METQRPRSFDRGPLVLLASQPPPSFGGLPAWTSRQLIPSPASPFERQSGAAGLPRGPSTGPSYLHLEHRNQLVQPGHGLTSFHLLYSMARQWCQDAGGQLGYSPHTTSS